MNVAAYDAAGRFYFVMQVSQDADLTAMRAAHAHVVTSETDLSDTWYDAVAQQVAPRTALPSPSKAAIAADGVDVAAWTGLPNPSTVYVAGQGVYQVTDGTFELTVEAAGEYRVTIFGPPSYRPREDVIRAG
jgi:hypothetical protein